MNEETRKFLADAGRKGGKSKSKKKLEALAKNRLLRRKKTVANDTN